MKRITQLLFAIVVLMVCKTSFAATWYVRADGGSRYSSSLTTGQCDGLADAAYPGKGQNQHCAFNDARYLYDDHTYNTLKWVIAGGDTVILDNTKQWRIGWDTATGSGEPWCWGWNGGPYGCSNPVVPAGTAAQHTRILGRNYAACSAGTQPDKTKMTQIFGGHGVGVALNLGGAQFVDVECIEITRHSQCVLHGNPAYPSECNTSYPLDDYDADGVTTNTGTHDVTLQDMWIHGHTDRGILGPIGGLITANRIDIDTNGMAGWDFDDGRATPNINGVLKMNYSTIEWSGCNQEYPAAHAIPVASCYGQSSGGYGDGIGTPLGDAMSVYIDHSIFRYNTQDGEDFGHIDTGANTLQITNSASYGNGGGQFKWGGNFTNVVFQNNIAVANCLRMSAPMTGVPSTYNANLGDFCRAEDGLSFDFVDGAHVLFANNTIVSYAPTTFDMQCWGTTCANTVFTMTNNIIRGYDNPSTYNLGGQSGGPGGFCGAGCNGSTALIGTINRTNNIYFGLRACPANQRIDAIAGVTSGESCSDANFVNEPAFANEASLDGLNFALASTSPAVYSGVAVAGLTTDYAGKPYHVPPSMGALEYGSGVLLSSITTPTYNTPSPIVSSPVVPTPPTPAPTNPTTPVSSGPVATVTALQGQSYKMMYQFVTITATVQPVSGSTKPTGSITLYTRSGLMLGTVALSTTGVASWSMPAAVEAVGVVAKYAGSTSFTGSTSATISIQPN